MDFPFFFCECSEHVGDGIPAPSPIFGDFGDPRGKPPFFGLVLNAGGAGGSGDIDELEDKICPNVKKCPKIWHARREKSQKWPN